MTGKLDGRLRELVQLLELLDDVRGRIETEVAVLMEAARRVDSRNDRPDLRIVR